MWWYSKSFLKFDCICMCLFNSFITLVPMTARVGLGTFALLATLRLSVRFWPRFWQIDLVRSLLARLPPTRAHLWRAARSLMLLGWLMRWWRMWGVVKGRGLFLSWRYMVEWFGSLWIVLEKKGFSVRWIKWIKGCVNSSCFTIVIIGKPGSWSEASGGLR